MTAGEFLVLLAQALILLLTAWKCVELVRHRDGARLDVALLLLSLSLAAGLRLIEEHAIGGLQPVRYGAVLAVAAHPLLLLRAVLHFRRVAGWIIGAFVVGLIASWALLLFTPAPWQRAGLLVVLAIFAAAMLYDVRSLTQGARHAQGVVRRRMGLVAVGALLLTGAAILYGIVHLRPGTGRLLEPIMQVSALALAICYSLGLATPPWLARAWQQADVQQFLRASTGTAGESTDRTLTRLCQTARHAVGGQAVALARWNGKRRRLELELRGERALVGGPLPADGLVAREWTFRRPFVASRRQEVHETCRRIAPGLDCDAILGMPLVTPTRVYGLLLVFLRRAPVLPDEDLRLLSLLSEHSAVILDYAALVERLRHDNAALRGEPPPEEALDEG